MNGTLAHRVPTNGSDHAAADTPGTRDRSIDANASIAHPALRLAACTPFVASAHAVEEDRAMAGQDPDIAPDTSARTLTSMVALPSPVSFQVRALRWLANLVRMLAGPSNPSPATGRPTLRVPLRDRALGFREFTAPRVIADAAQRLRVKSTGGSARVSSPRGRSRS